VVDGATVHIAWDDLHIDDRNKSNVKFTIGVLDEILDSQQQLVSQLRTLSIRLYGELLGNLTKTMLERMQEVSRAIGLIDLYIGMHQCAAEYSYCRPKICVREPGAESSLAADKLRHPLVERNNAYVAQNIRLGQQYSQIGMLLYGVNQTGKSCLMKSVGVAVIMAQAGLYVAASSFTYTPYELLSTRILGNDNIDRGLSTFAVEMIELRSILTRCSNRSLSLGDEVCHGTESASAVSLVSASIRHMARAGANFIFATHLHELSKLEEVTQLDSVRHYHLSIDFDGDKIVYNRIMKEGSGLGLYGIEVAKHLKLPADVLDDAYRIRNRYFSQAVKMSDLRESRYSSRVVVSQCRIGECREPATETHHIRHQAAGVIVDGMHMNNPDNLVPLCNSHHNMLHGKGGPEGKILVIYGYGPDKKVEYSFRRRVSSLL
jgi:DNA mismatch repair protein MutS